jgi:tRNA(Ile)-lysidine synthase
VIKFDKTLKSSKNLLAFSAGVDSTALFFLLLESDIKFDIAIVNYNLRTQSKLEVQYAKDLAKKYNKKIFIKEIDKNEVDKIKQNNFEAKAREIRYDFFLTCIDENSYDTLLMAHHLGDRLEWFLMQLSKGAGLYELAGMKSVEKRDSYSLIRPLLHVSKDELKITFINII